MFGKNVSKIVSMGYTGNLPTNKIRKKTSIKKRFHKKMSQRPYQWGIQVSYKKTRRKNFPENLFRKQLSQRSYQ